MILGERLTTCGSTAAALQAYAWGPALNTLRMDEEINSRFRLLCATTISGQSSVRL